MSRINTPHIRVFVMLGFAVALAGCAANPATGGRDFTPFMSPSQERAIGAREHPQVLQQFGGAYNEGDVAAYVATVGARVAANSELPDLSWKFTVLNSSIPNAMALPGGYIYVTRGLLAIMNSEAELAGVLGHEVGHVTARHSAKRYSSAAGVGIGAALLGAVTGNSNLQEIAQTGGSLYLASYSRGQEFQADDLGVRYLARSGYDPFAQADVLDTLGMVTDLEARIAGRDSGQGFFSTHPRSPERVSRAREKAGETEVQPNTRPRRESPYLAAIDGMIYGDDPALGVVDGNTFWHGPLGLTFSVPDGFSLVNTSSAVLAKGPSGSAMAFSGSRVSAGVSMRDYLVSDYGKSLKLNDVRGLRLNGMEAATGRTRTTANGKTVDVRLVTVRFSRDRVYRFQFVSDPRSTNALDRQFLDIATSLRPITATEARLIPVRRIKVLTVEQGETVDELAELMAVPAHQRERFLALNGMRPGDRLRAGDRVKIVVDE
ncbi:MAG: M48 family metalloprotease [Alphaproteobacteria bacterium]